MNSIISPATRRNWERLHTDSKTRLTRRANKHNSRKTFLPVEYSTGSHLSFFRQLTDHARTHAWDTEAVLYALALKLLARQGLLDKPHVRHVLQQYAPVQLPDLSGWDIPSDEWDLLGFVYQSLQQEGRKNRMGSYYTPREIACQLTADLDFSHGQTFLDPCCGSGSFLLAAPAVSPRQLFGMDIDPIAVMIAKINLLLRYPEEEFDPQVYCVNYLMDSAMPQCPDTCSYIVTNPPWGAAPVPRPYPAGVVSGESFSCFFVKAYDQLAENGCIRFLFPESILHVRAHQDIRCFLQKHCRMERIIRYADAFSGVVTKCAAICCRKAPPADTVLLQDAAGTYSLLLSDLVQTRYQAFCFLTSQDAEILSLLRQQGHYDLSHSDWALGIVTGDNRHKLRQVPESGWEPIYTGREITRYTLKPAKNYLLYDRSQLQQAAPDSLYRAPEKLVYKFISDRPVFAYDASGSLFLNSANILIPQIPGMSIKTVLALLNSELFAFYYTCLFADVKILRGSLSELRFPRITPEQNRQLEAMTDAILQGKLEQDMLLQDAIYALYPLSDTQIRHIRQRIKK